MRCVRVQLCANWAQGRQGGCKRTPAPALSERAGAEGGKRHRAGAFSTRAERNRGGGKRKACERAVRLCMPAAVPAKKAQETALLLRCLRLGLQHAPARAALAQA